MAIKFGTDGWRGLIDKDFNEENVALASQAIAKYFNDNHKEKLVIGFDIRYKANIFAKICAEVMAANGIKVYLADKACPTPVVGWAIKVFQTDGAIMFTASHNPAEFLGLKFMTEEAMVAPNATTDAFVANLAELTASKIKRIDFDEGLKNKKIEYIDAKTPYLAKLSELVDLKKLKSANLKVLINPMHAAGIGYLSEILGGGNLKISTINNTYDHNFGGKSPEPIVEKNVADAIAKVKEEKFDICLSSDGDADRIGLIDENGQMLTSLEAFLLLSYYFVVVKEKHGPIVKTLSNTIMVDHLLAEFNLPVYEVKVGFKYVGEKMKETGAIFGGEESGGSAIDEFILVRDAQIMQLFILDLMVTLNKPISQILTEVEEEIGGGYKFKRVDVHFEYEKYDEIKNKKAPELVANPPAEILGKEVVKTRTDDGVKLFFADDSWLLIRFSGTEPVLRLYAEAKSESEVDALIKYAEDYFGKQ